MCEVSFHTSRDDKRNASHPLRIESPQYRSKAGAKNWKRHSFRSPVFDTNTYTVDTQTVNFKGDERRDDRETMMGKECVEERETSPSSFYRHKTRRQFDSSVRKEQNPKAESPLHCFTGKGCKEERGEQRISAGKYTFLHSKHGQGNERKGNRMERKKREAAVKNEMTGRKCSLKYQT